MTDGPQPVEETADPGHVRLAAILTAVVIFSLWLMPLVSSLWLDELGTWWVVKDGAGDAVHRALTFHGQSPLYYLIVWAARDRGRAIRRWSCVCPRSSRPASPRSCSIGSLGP